MSTAPAKPLRISNGDCQYQHGFTSRITSSYVEGKGDYTTGHLFDPQIVQTHQDLFYEQMESLSRSIPLCLSYVQDQRTRAVLKWIVEAIPSFNADLCMRGKYSTHQIDPQSLMTLSNLIKDWKEELGGAEEFIYYLDPKIAAIDALRVIVSSGQTHFRTVLKGLSLEDRENLLPLGQTLNRLRTFLFWAARWEAKSQGIEEYYWNKHIPPFPKLQ